MSDARGGGDRRRGPRQKSRTAPAERSRRGSPARRTAHAVLQAVGEGAYANLELPKALRRARLDDRDAAFATELTYGTLRMQGFYDAVITEAAGRATSRLDGGVLDVLRMGAHQVLAMRVPDHAAADQAVALARSVAGPGAAGLVNAVMRRISESSVAEWRERVVPVEPLAERLSIEHSHPVWIVKALRQALIGHGVATSETADNAVAELLAAHNVPAPVSLVARPGLAEVDELLGAGAHVGRWSPFAAELDGGDPGAIAAVRDGRAAVQDEGSQLLALALAAAPVSGRGDGATEQWLDLCAGPGGKAGLLAAEALAQGADLVANEISDHRAELVRQTLRPALTAAQTAGRHLEVRTGDGREFGVDEPERYDRVLVDAPCTGLGALRRRPEARWRRQPSDLVGLGPLQRGLLVAAIEATRPGGVVAYATCSPHLSETTFVVRDVLKKRDDVEQIEARDLLAHVATGGLTDLGDGPHAQMWPHIHGTDGMFLAVLRKRA
ncbi:RsmB/NOP family class I SAM-dependent RNA methyltransferase [Janibacter alittae]|uniref:Transcription antitermination factor NusB n=1 Tax=Janibacter alittae TaxID=3115209 RepID=A0ABZ2MDM8_9MICO